MSLRGRLHRDRPLYFIWRTTLPEEVRYCEQKKKNRSLYHGRLVCLLTLAGCGRNYEPVEVPALEEASGDITPENGEETAAVSIEAETGNGKRRQR